MIKRGREERQKEKRMRWKAKQLENAREKDWWRGERERKKTEREREKRGKIKTQGVKQLNQ